MKNTPNPQKSFRQNRLERKFRKSEKEKTLQILHPILMGLSYLCNIVAIGTAFAFVFSFWTDVVPVMFLSVILSVIFLILVEIVQISIIKNAVEQYYNKNSLSFKALSLAIVAVTSFSIFMSFKGSVEGVKQVSSTVVYSMPTLVNTNEIRGDFDERIRLAESNVSRLKGGRFRNNDAYNKYLNAITLVQTLSSKKFAKLDAVRAANALSIKKSKEVHSIAVSKSGSEATSNGYALGWISIITQMLFILSMVYKEVIDRKEGLKRNIIGSEPREVEVINSPDDNNFSIGFTASKHRDHIEYKGKLYTKRQITCQIGSYKNRVEKYTKENKVDLVKSNQQKVHELEELLK